MNSTTIPIGSMPGSASGWQTLQSAAHRPAARAVPKSLKWLCIVLIAMNGLEAYAVGPIPITWIGQFASALMLPLLICYRIRIPGEGCFALLATWCFFTTLFNGLWGGYSQYMPPLATTPYPVFIALRILGLLSYMGMLRLVAVVCAGPDRDAMIGMIVRLGVFMSLAALYIYVAQLIGLPEPPRTRVGTSGGEQSTEFAYAFHRAMGTFREPSHLAEWIVLPMYLSLSQRDKALTPSSMLIGMVFLLTGSLNAIVAAVAAAPVTALMLNPATWSPEIGKLMCRMGIAVVVMIVCFSFVVSGDANLFGVLQDRINDILEGGMEASNRAFLYFFLQDVPPPVLGHGMGNANLILTEYCWHIHYAENMTGMPVGFMSLYVCFLYSGGPLALLLVLATLARPILAGLRARLAGNSRSQSDLRWLCILAPFVAWCVMVQFRSEDFSVMFGVAHGVLATQIATRKSASAALEPVRAAAA